MPQQVTDAVRSPVVPPVKLQAHPYGSAPAVLHATWLLPSLHIGMFVLNVPLLTMHPPLMSCPVGHYNCKCIVGKHGNIVMSVLCKYTNYEAFSKGCGLLVHFVT